MHMRCDEVRGGLSAFLDGDLPAGRAEGVRTHLETCATCRAELALLQRTVEALRRLPDLPPPAGILSGVRARLAPEPWHARLRRRLGNGWAVGIPAGLAASLVVALGVAFFQSRYPELGKREPLADRPRVERAAPPPAATTVSPAAPAKEAGPQSPATVPPAAKEKAAPATAAPRPETRPATATTAAPAAPPSPARPASAPPPAATTFAPSAPAPAPPPRRDALPAAEPARPTLPLGAESRAPGAGLARPDDIARMRATEERVGLPGTASLPPQPAGARAAPARDVAAPASVPALSDELGMRDEAGATADRESGRPVARPQRRPPTSMLPPDIVEHERPPARPAAARPRAEYAREQASPAPAPERRARLPLPPALPMPRPPSASGLRGAAKAERSAEVPARATPEVLFVVSQDARSEAELRRLIRREGGGLLEVRPLEPRAAREALRQWRDRIPPSQQVTGGQRIRAQIPRRNLQRFLGAIDRHPRMQLLDRRAAPAPRGDRRERQAVEIRLYR